MIRLAFTRPADRIADSLRAAEALGMEAMAAPSLTMVAGDPAELARARRMLESGTADIVIVGSAAAVGYCAEGFGADAFREMLGPVVVVPIGPGTAEALAGHGIRCDLMPEDDHSSYGILALLDGDVAGRMVMLIRSDRGSDVMPEGLARRGARVADIAAYRLEPAGMTPEALRIIGALDAGELDAMAFTSPLSAESFIGMLRERLGDGRAAAALDGVAVAAIGTPTAIRLGELGRRPDIVPVRTTFADMLAAIAVHGGFTIRERPGTGPGQGEDRGPGESRGREDTERRKEV